MSRLFDNRATMEISRPNGVTFSTSFDCCLMDGSFDEPFGPAATDSNRRNISVVAKSVAFGEFTPQVGDIITMVNGKRFAVKRVQPFYSSEYIMDCRSC